MQRWLTATVNDIAYLWRCVTDEAARCSPFLSAHLLISLYGVVHSFSVFMRGQRLISLALLALVTTFAATILRRDGTPDSNIPAGYQYSGCYVDSFSARSLNSASYADNSGMTGDACIAFCGAKGYSVAGTEYSSECYCGTALPARASTGCNMACSGDASQHCGGPDRLLVYTSTSSGPVTNPAPAGFLSLGCYTDSVSARTLSRVKNVPGGSNALTVALCV